MSDSYSYTGGKQIALDEFKKDTPPGWEPFLSWYPLKDFLSNMELWGHLISENGTRPSMSVVGPQVIGRLRGQAKRLAKQVDFTFPIALAFAN